LAKAEMGTDVPSGPMDQLSPLFSNERKKGNLSMMLREIDKRMYVDDGGRIGE